MVNYKIMCKHEINESSLDGFRRYTKTTKMWILKNGILNTKSTSYIDAWSDEKLKEISHSLKHDKGIVLFAYEGSRVVGFANLVDELSNGYIIMPNIHVSQDYRGKKIGSMLFELICIEARKQGAYKLFISGHPSIETQSFYESLGCKLAQEENVKLKTLEPYDIQLEYELYNLEFYLELIKNEITKYDKLNCKAVTKISNQVSKHMPLIDLEYIHVCRLLMINQTRTDFSIATTLLKKRGSTVDAKYLNIYEDILLHMVKGWGQVDQYCYRVLNPIFNDDLSLFPYLERWSKSLNSDVRRASLVAMIKSSNRLTLDYEYKRMMKLVDRLRYDDDFHVKKAVGWVLKCAYLTYPQEVEKYLREEVRTLDRIIFRYALEHFDKDLKAILMKL